MIDPSKKSIELRDWQKEALEQYHEALQQERNQVLWEATPGAGKTTAALQLCIHQLKSRRAKRVIIVVPTAHLKLQWAASGTKFGLNLDSSFRKSSVGLSPDFRGLCVTYQQVAQAPRYFQTLAQEAVVVLDEVHHSADGLSWGDAMRVAFAQCSFVLCLSGTAFRSDNNTIPFVRYDEQGLSISDYIYSYTQAIEDKVCRATAFFVYGGDLAWRENETISQVNFNDELDREGASRRLRAALDPQCGWIDTMLEDANNMLLKLRRTQPNAGGLLVAADQDHARALATLIKRRSMVTPTIVLSDDRTASKKIKQFAESNAPWIVACNMVSEGVDIPRLSVGVYATTIRTRMYFRQFLGRIVRHQPGVAAEAAYCYLPADPYLKVLAEEIESQTRHNIAKTRDNEFEDRQQESVKEKEDHESNWEAISGTNSGVASLILSGNQLSLFGTTPATSTMARAEMFAEVVAQQVNVVHTKAEAKKAIAKQIQQLVTLYHNRTNIARQEIHTQLNRRQNVRTQGECTEQQLKERLMHLELMLSNAARISSNLAAPRPLPESAAKIFRHSSHAE